MNPIHLAWLTEIGIITWRSVRVKKRPPLPSELLATFIAFGSLTLMDNGQWEKPAEYIAWGLVLATFMNFVDPLTGKPGAAPSQTAGKGK